MEKTNVQDSGIRLNKYLSDAGVCSRREADRLAENGRITVDGITAQPGTKVMPGQIVCVDGKAVGGPPEKVLIALNKPRGIVCTTDRVREKDNIVDFLKYPERIYPVGRLDKDSEGLILLTNDGSLVNHILKGSMYHEKEYIVTVEKPLTEAFLKGMAAGVEIPDGKTRPCKVKKISERTFSIILTQGMNRQIRYMCRHFDYHVRRLKRIRIMNITLGDLQTGKWRYVTPEELEKMREMFGKEVRR